MFTSFVVHAVVGLTLGLIAHVVVVVFVVAILQRSFCIWRYTLYTSRHIVLHPPHSTDAGGLWTAISFHERLRVCSHLFHIVVALGEIFGGVVSPHCKRASVSQKKERSDRKKAVEIE